MIQGMDYIERVVSDTLHLVEDVYIDHFRL